MARVVDGGVDLFDALTYGSQHPGTQEFFQHQMERLSGAMDGLSQQFTQSMHTLYDRFSSSNAMRYAVAAKRAVGSLWQSDEIRRLATIGDFQHASPVMQRWVMAEPTVRHLYHQQRCEGYEGSYVDLHPGDVGEAHYDYRRVMDGIVKEDPNDPDNWVAVSYLDDPVEGDVPLFLEQQVDILDTWTSVVDFIREGKADPTSRWNADL